MDLFDKCAVFNKGRLDQYSGTAENYFMFPKIEGEIGPVMIFDGKPMIIWGINNYLGFANDPEIKALDAEFASWHGLGYPMGSRMMTGSTREHDKLEEELSVFSRKEASFLLNYGYQGMISIIDALTSRRDVVVYDAECHACIIDGIRLHQGARRSYVHNNMESLTKALIWAQKAVKGTDGGILVITEGVFGMSGSIGNIKAITDLKNEFSFRLLLDDAHGFGVMGKEGRGTSEHFGVEDGVDLYFSTFAKGLASIGGFIAGDKKVIHYLKYNMRSQIFAKALPLACVMGNLERLRRMQAQPFRREKLWTIARALQKGFREDGFDIGTTQSQVTPVFLPIGIHRAIEFVRIHRDENHIFCPLVVYPVVPKDTVMLRFIPTSTHDLEHVDKTVKTLSSSLKTFQEKMTSEAV